MIQRIKDLSNHYFDKIVAFRRHLHKHPELSFKEYETTKFIIQSLQELNIPISTKFSNTGVVATIKGKQPNSKTIALRADIDALPIQEDNTISYKSIHEGVMHACGHDVHAACLFGSALILNKLKDELKGTIQLIFQPGEEKLPGGASIMIENGVLENPPVDAIFGQHVFPELEVGKVGFRSGLYMASADELHITIQGQGGHAALATNLRDPIEAMNHLLISLRKAVKEISCPEIPYVIGFGHVEAKGATNVIPNKVSILGTFRTMNEEWRMKAHQILQEKAQEIAQQFKVEIDCNILVGYPVLNNDVELTKFAKQAAIEFLGKENVIDLPIRMSSEDFAYYTHHTKGCFYRLGTSSSPATQNSVHTPCFNIDENALKLGTGLMAYLALKQNQ